MEDPKTMWHCMTNAHSIIRFLIAETCETVSMCSARGESKERRGGEGGEGGDRRWDGWQEGHLKRR